MNRFEYRQMMTLVHGGMKLSHCIWDNRFERVRSTLSSKYACKVWIRNNQEEIEIEDESLPE